MSLRSRECPSSGSDLRAVGAKVGAPRATAWVIGACTDLENELLTTPKRKSLAQGPVHIGLPIAQPTPWKNSAPRTSIVRVLCYTPSKDLHCECNVV